MGTPGPNNGLQNIFSPNSSRTLNGQAQTSSDSTLTTSLSGRVVDVLPNGFLVIEAERQMYMNNQHQTVVIHGVVRPGTSARITPFLRLPSATWKWSSKGRA